MTEMTGTSFVLLLGILGGLFLLIAIPGVGLLLCFGLWKFWQYVAEPTKKEGGDGDG